MDGMGGGGGAAAEVAAEAAAEAVAEAEAAWRRRRGRWQRWVWVGIAAQRQGSCCAAVGWEVVATATMAVARQETADGAQAMLHGWRYTVMKF